VLVVVDIDALKRTEQAISEARAYAEDVLRTVRDPLIVLSADLCIHSANDCLLQHLQGLARGNRGALAL